METKLRTCVVWLILNGEAEKALKLLADHYGVNAPKIKVGLPKGRKKKTLGCYSSKNKTVSVLNNDVLKEPLVVLHEFYHHLRTTDSKHKGTEKHANKFANEFIQDYRRFLVRKTLESTHSKKQSK